MKNQLMLFLSFLILGNISLSAQTANIYDNPKYGVDSSSRMECANNLSTMSEFMKIDLYSYALLSWQRVFSNCPEASKNIYLYGIKIYRDKVENAKTTESKASSLDTLMLIYDKRIEFFGQEAQVLGRKGLDLFKYDRNQIESAYKILKRSVELGKNQSEPAVLLNLMQLSNALFQEGKVDGREFIDNYLITTEIFETQIKSGKPNSQSEMALESIESIFAQSGAADCATLVEIFSPKFKETPDDLDFLKKITTLLANQNCEDSKLFADASENLYKLESSSQAAYNLARLFFKKEDYQKAVNYYEEAIANETDNDRKAKFQYELALINFSKYDDYEKARTLARNAIENKPDWGEPYILIGNLYASSSSRCGENDFEKTTIFWAAVDKFAKAKSMDPSVSDAANELIKKYSEYFPNVEDAFFYGFENGASYRVGCWINENTTVRSRQRP